MMIDQLCKLYPQVRDHIDYKDFATPITNKHYIAQPYGELYGLDHTAKRMAPSMAAKLRPETDIPGLYLTGQVSYFEYKFLLHSMTSFKESKIPIKEFF